MVAPVERQTVVAGEEETGCRLVELDHQFINDYSNYTCKYAVSCHSVCCAMHSPLPETFLFLNQESRIHG